jgi:polysaccharide deacetylase family protein (PEP-CTERM system associated)
LNGAAATSAERPTILLSVDFEDWHQLVHRRAGLSSSPGPALRRQTEATLGLLDELRVKATFFILGMAARSHPDLVEAIAARGHDIACHGDQHRPVHSQTPAEFTADLRAARQTIEQLSGRRPIGYRAPAFSITRASSWAYDVLASEGFVYDASQYDSPALRDRTSARSSEPHLLELAGRRVLWEFPVAVWQLRGVPYPIGGPSYWAVTPRAVVLHGLQKTGRMAGLYLHPYELDPQRLSPLLGQGASVRARAHEFVRATKDNFSRRRVGGVLRAIARRFQLIPYAEAYAQLSACRGARPEPVQN